METPPDPLDPILDRWEAPGPPPQMGAEVWRRIALAEGARRDAGWWASLDAWLARPPFAVLFLACCALLGLFLAEVRVNRAQRQHNTQLVRSYLQLIDPLLKAAPAARAP